MTSFLLGQGDGLGLLVADLDSHAALGSRDGEIAIAEAADEVEGLLDGLLLREPQSVLRDVLLDGLAHVRRGPEEAIGRHEAVHGLVRTLEVVGIHEERQTTGEIIEVGKDGARQELSPQGLPEAFDLAERLRVLRPALDVADTLAPQLLLELGLAPPRGVLAALIGEDLARRAEGRDTPAQRFHDESRALVVRQGVRYDEARMVVHEGGDIDPLVPPEQESEDVRLPELVGLGPLEAPWRVRARRR
ncbi:MAG: hypothetical protein JNK60_03305 [Acidobacteria bacterium]|nr:hypothetical protein [Acidobacteriota bacterium]